MLPAETLRQYTPLHNLSEANLARLARRLTVEELPKGAVLCREGDTDNDAIYLLEGGIELTENTATTARSTTLQIARESYGVTQQAARISTNRKVK